VQEVDASSPSPWRGVILSISLAVAFLLLSFATMGISQADDSYYLTHAVSMPQRDFLRFHNWAPLYEEWLKLGSFVWIDPVWRLLGSWAVLTAALLLLPTAFRMRYAWAYTLILVVLDVPWFNPFIGMFAGTIMVLAMCLMLRAKPTLSEALTASCATCFVIAQCRPEFDYGVFLAALVTLVAVVLEWASEKERDPLRSVRLLLLSAGVVLLSTVTIYILRHAVSQRTGMAFAQHFNLRASMRGAIPFGAGSWVSDYAERQFGIDLAHNASNGTATVMDFFRANPRLFLSHVAANAVSPKTLLMIVAMLTVIIWPWVRDDVRYLRPVSLFYACLAVPGLMDLFVVFPREHYMVIEIPTIVLFLLQLIRPRWVQPPMPWALAGGVALMACTNYVVPAAAGAFPTMEQMELSQVECMRAIDASIPANNHVVFNASWIEHGYLSPERRDVDPALVRDWADFKQWALQTRPAWITSDKAQALPTRYNISPMELSSFLTGELGYVAHSCPARAGLTIYTAQPPGY
jgi:hypothetical protein